MEHIEFIIVISVILIYLWIWYSQEPINEEDKIIDNIIVNHIDGILDLPPQTECNIKFNKKQLTINDRHIVKISNINSSEVIKSTELLEKEKSIIGRALVGGILLGGIGAILGGMTGLKNGKEIKDVDLLIINYQNTKNECSQLIFMKTGWLSYQVLKDFSNKLNKLIGYTPQFQENKPIEL